MHVLKIIINITYFIPYERVKCSYKKSCCCYIKNAMNVLKNCLILLGRNFNVNFIVKNTYFLISLFAIDIQFKKKE